MLSDASGALLNEDFSFVPQGSEENSLVQGEWQLRGGGSIAVDDDGFIYVADVGNRRIQKFAP